MSQTTRRSLLKTLGVGGTVFAFGAGAGYAQMDSGSDSEGGASEGVSFPPSDDTALLRALHASPDAPAVDVYVDGEQVAQGVEFGSITGYLELSPGEVEVQVYPSEDGGAGTTGTENETTTESEGLGNETTEDGAAATNETTEGGAAVENETTEGDAAATNETTEGGAAVGNETTEGGDAAATNETTEGGAAVENETTEDAGGLGTETETGSTGQTPSGEPVIDESVTVQGGKSYTVAAINQLDDIEALVLEDEPEDDQTQDEEANTAMVRSVHLSPDASTLKVRVDSHVVGSALEYEEASSYADVQTGTSQVEVLPTGSADPLSTANYEFEAGKRYNLFLIGMVDPEAASAQGGLEAATGNQTETGNETTTESEGLGNETTETELGTGNETTTEAGAGVTNETTTEAGAGVTNETTEAGAAVENETTESGGMTNETTTESEGLGNETTEDGAAATNETTEGGAAVENETTEAGAAVENETTTEAGAGGAENQTQAESFRILAVQDGTGSVLEEAEEEGTPSADDLLPVDLSDDNGSDENATAENETVENGTAENATAENGTAENGTTENETTANGTATNGTATEVGNATTSD